MPSTSAKQAKFMRAVAHSPKFAKKVGVPQSVGKDYEMADKKKGKFGSGGPTNVEPKGFKPIQRFKLPDDQSMQFPTGRYVTPEGELVIEGTGVIPDILVPVTVESALGRTDTALQAAVEALLKEIR